VHVTEAVAQSSPGERLWAAIGVTKPVFQFREADTINVLFFVVNAGQAAADPHVGSSHLFINGVEPGSWPIVINNGIRNSYFQSLPSGKLLSFTYQLNYFVKPGIYTLLWQGQDFKSAEVTFRVLPDGSWY
jgi:hypothetical protein